eukprot:PhM_4_TR6793/c0_g1_i1/m.84877
MSEPVEIDVDAEPVSHHTGKHPSSLPPETAPQEVTRSQPTDDAAATKIQAVFRGSKVRQQSHNEEPLVISLPDSEDTNTHAKKKRGIIHSQLTENSKLKVVPMSSETLGMATVYTRMMNTDLWW